MTARMVPSRCTTLAVSRPVPATGVGELGRDATVPLELTGPVLAVPNAASSGALGDMDRDLADSVDVRARFAVMSFANCVSCPSDCEQSNRVVSATACVHTHASHLYLG